MSISEAVQLIIKTSTIGEKGEIFVLDMGQPVKIIDLAKDLIKISGPFFFGGMYIRQHWEVNESYSG